MLISLKPGSRSALTILALVLLVAGIFAFFPAGPVQGQENRPFVTITPVHSRVTHGGTVTLTLSRTGDTSSSLEVEVLILEYPRLGPSDGHNRQDPRVTFEAGAKEATFDVSVSDEELRTFVRAEVRLFGTPPAYRLGSPNVANITIVASNDTDQFVSIAADDSATAEGYGLGYLFTELHTKGLANDSRHIRR